MCPICQLHINATSPATSIPNLYQELALFTMISGLTVNHAKSQALNLTLEDGTVNSLQQNFPFKWQNTAFSYLVIYLTHSIDLLYHKNNPPLYKKLQKDFTRWMSNPSSWFSRLSSVKTNILPRILYLFRTLLIMINMSNLCFFQQKVLKII